MTGTAFPSGFLLSNINIERQIIPLLSMLQSRNPFASRCSRQMFINDKKKNALYFWHILRECLPRCFFQIIIRTYVHVVSHACTRSPRKAFDIQRFKSNKNVPSAMAGFVKATLCVLDAKIWIIRVLHVFFKEETRCKLEADFSASYFALSLFPLSLRRKVAAVICFTCKKGWIICIASLF